jgi:hypothetical protein
MVSNLSALEGLLFQDGTHFNIDGRNCLYLRKEKHLWRLATVGGCGVYNIGYM